MPSSEILTPKSPSPSLKMGMALFCALLCLLPLIQTVAPRALGFVPPAMGIIFFCALRIFSGSWPRLSLLYVAIAVGTASLAALSALWSLNPDFALERGLKIVGVLGGGCALYAVLRANTSWPSFLYWAFPLALIFAGLLCIFELWTNGFLYHTWRGTDAANYNLSIINRAVVSFTLLLLPALGFLSLSSCSALKKRLMQLSFLLIMIVIACMTDSQSAHLALLVAGIFWFAFPLFKRKAAQSGLIILICAGILAGPWLVQLLYNVFADYVHTMPWLADAYAADRLEIWDFVARKALDSPIFGFGIEATRHIEHFNTPMRYTPLDHVLHPHNAVLQIWIEFGLIGILGLCAAMVLVLHSMFRIESEPARRLCLSVFMMALVTACISYGLWQGWWLGLLTMVTGLCGHIARKKKAALQRPLHKS